MIERHAIMRRWADATRGMQWQEAEMLWAELMREWLRPPPREGGGTDQGYWNDLLDRRMRVLERREQRSTISDNEWDRRHEDVNS